MVPLSADIAPLSVVPLSVVLPSEDIEAPLSMVSPISTEFVLSSPQFVVNTNVETPNYNTQDIATPLLTGSELDVVTPNYNLYSPSTSFVTFPGSPQVDASELESDVTVPPPEEEFSYRDRKYTASQLAAAGLTWAIVQFFFGVCDIGVLFYALNKRVMARCHPPICLFGYGNFLAMLTSSLRIITAGLNGSNLDPRFPWSVDVRNTTLLIFVCCSFLV